LKVFDLFVDRKIAGEKKIVGEKMANLMQKIGMGFTKINVIQIEPRNGPKETQKANETYKQKII
jgi:hypothetical protein